MWDYLCILGALCLADRGLRRWVTDTKTRWFVLHALANTAIAAVVLPAFAQAWRRPEWSVYMPAGDEHRSRLDSAVIGALHLYHALAFPMDADDWFHHLLFIPFNQLAVALPRWMPADAARGGWRWGPCIQMQHFFICGLPGAIDYGSLALVRAGRLGRLRQKRLQARLNLWLRCPGVLFTISLLLFETARAAPPPPAAAVAIVALDTVLIGFNSLYYTERVIASYCRHAEFRHPPRRNHASTE